MERSDDEWRNALGSERYRVLRLSGTEMPFTGKYYHNHRSGTYHCAGCGALLFDSEHKYDSGSGWPSFSDLAEQGSIEVRLDRGHGMDRTEVLCRRCGGHLGHVFDDGPAPAGKRYCINSASLRFVDENGQKD